MSTISKRKLNAILIGLCWLIAIFWALSTHVWAASAQQMQPCETVACIPDLSRHGY